MDRINIGGGASVAPLVDLRNAFENNLDLMKQPVTLSGAAIYAIISDLLKVEQKVVEINEAVRQLQLQIGEQTITHSGLTSIKTPEQLNLPFPEDNHDGE